MKITEVAAGLVFRCGRLLITQRRPQDHLGGLWEFPGGKREPGESYEGCLHRELEEELGVQVADLALIGEVTHAYPEKNVHIQFFACKLVEGEPAPLGCSALKWVTPAELTQHTFPAADAQLLQRLTETPEIWQGHPMRCP
jgi:8-oxo-dGTP diphosphatase